MLAGKRISLRMTSLILLSALIAAIIALLVQNEFVIIPGSLVIFILGIGILGITFIALKR